MGVGKPGCVMLWSYSYWCDMSELFVGLLCGSVYDGVDLVLFVISVRDFVTLELDTVMLLLLVFVMILYY